MWSEVCLARLPLSWALAKELTSVMYVSGLSAPVGISLFPGKLGAPCQCLSLSAETPPRLHVPLVFLLQSSYVCFVCSVCGFYLHFIRMNGKLCLLPSFQSKSQVLYFMEQVYCPCFISTAGQ